MFSVNHHYLGFGYPEPFYGFCEHFPGEAFALSSSTVQPFEGTFHGPSIKAP